jgi:hypothetical protein
VAQLYPQAPSTHFSRLLRHAWATVGLLFSPVTTRGVVVVVVVIIIIKIRTSHSQLMDLLVCMSTILLFYECTNMFPCTR